MAKKEKEIAPKRAKSAKKPAEAAGAPKKPTLLKRIVNTIESISKDKKKKESAEQAVKNASATRKQSLDQAVEDLQAGPGSEVQAASTLAAVRKEVFTENATTKIGDVETTGIEKTASNAVIMTVPPISSVYHLTQAESPAASAKAAKFDIEPPHTPPTTRKPVAPIALAEQIFATRLVLLVRDPETLYAYWDVSDGDRKLHRLDALVSPRHLALRLYDHGREAQPSSHPLVYIDFLLQPGVDSRYLRLPLKDRWWRADLGIKDEIVGFTSLARSNTVRSPRDQVAEWGAGVKPLMSAHAADAETAAATHPEGISAAPAPTREGIFENTFRLSGGSHQGITGAKEEIIEKHTVTKSVLRVRPVGSSAMTSEEERETLTTLKVRSVGASDLSSRQG